jgi:hypothetical protein
LELVKRVLSRVGVFGVRAQLSEVLNTLALRYPEFTFSLMPGPDFESPLVLLSAKAKGADEDSPSLWEYSFNPDTLDDAFKLLMMLDTLHQSITRRAVIQQEIEGTLDELRNVVDEALPAESQDKAPTAIGDTLQRLEDRLKELEAINQELTAPVLLPRREAMSVRLVDVTLLDRLEEARADATQMSSVMALFIGAILGIVVNWATAEALVITRVSLVLLVVLGSLAVATYLWWRGLQARAERVKQRMLQDNMRE